MNLRIVPRTTPYIKTTVKVAYLPRRAMSCHVISYHIIEEKIRKKAPKPTSPPNHVKSPLTESELIATKLNPTQAMYIYKNPIIVITVKKTSE